MAEKNQTWTGAVELVAAVNALSDPVAADLARPDGGFVQNLTSFCLF